MTDDFQRMVDRDDDVATHLTKAAQLLTESTALNDQALVALAKSNRALRQAKHWSTLAIVCLVCAAVAAAFNLFVLFALRP